MREPRIADGGRAPFFGAACSAHAEAGGATRGALVAVAGSGSGALSTGIVFGVMVAAEMEVCSSVLASLWAAACANPVTASFLGATIAVFVLGAQPSPAAV